LDLDQLVQQSFADVAVNKGMSRRYGSRDRAIPDYVSDWLVTRYASDDGSCDEQRIGEFLARHLPDKKQKQAVLNEMREGGEVKILDAYTVRVDIGNNRLLLDAPLLDVSNGGVDDEIVQQYPLLLHGNVWGSGTLISSPRRDDTNKHEVRMVAFKPMQTSIVDLDYYISQRRLYTLDQWRALLVGSMGYSPDFYSPRQQMHLLTRLCPLVQARTNLIELAPKGTGKSHVFSRLSRYALLIVAG